MRNIRKNGLNKSLLVCTVLVFAVITLFVVMSVGQQSAIAEAAEHQTNNMTLRDGAKQSEIVAQCS